MTGNGLIMAMVIWDRSLHEPMYLFLAMLVQWCSPFVLSRCPKCLSPGRAVPFQCFLPVSCRCFLFMLCFSLNLLSYWPWLLTAMWLSVHHSIILPYLQALSLAKWSWLCGSKCGCGHPWHPVHYPPALARANITCQTYSENMGIAKLACNSIVLIVHVYGLTAALLTPQDWTLSLSPCPLVNLENSLPTAF